MRWRQARRAAAAAGFQQNARHYAFLARADHRRLAAAAPTAAAHNTACAVEPPFRQRQGHAPAMAARRRRSARAGFPAPTYAIVTREPLHSAAAFIRYAERRRDDMPHATMPRDDMSMMMQRLPCRQTMARSFTRHILRLHAVMSLNAMPRHRC